MLQDIKQLLERNALILAIVATLVIAILSLGAAPKMDFAPKLGESSTKTMDGNT